MSKVKMELREFHLDNEVSPRPGEVSDTIDDKLDPVVSYWLRIRSMNSPLSQIMYAHFAQLALEPNLHWLSLSPKPTASVLSVL